LKRKGIVASRRGRRGGYVLIKRPEELTVGAVLRAIDGPIAPLPCISQTAYRRCADCRDEKTCMVRRLFKDTHAATLLLLLRTTLPAALERPERVRTAGLDRLLPVEGETISVR